jgi:PKD repeat protein
MKYVLLVLALSFKFLSGAQFNSDSLMMSKSVHQSELEYYNSLGNANADHYDSIVNPIKMTREKGGCQLSKIVYGWHPYWNSNTHQNYQWDLLSHLSFFSYEVNSADGQPLSTHGWSTSAAVDAALANNVKVTLCVTLFSGHSAFFGSSTAQQTLITNLINLVQTRGAHGVNIDFEGLPSSQTTNFANFMVNLANQMHSAIPGSEVSTVLYAVDWSNVFDFSIMEPEVDNYIIMGYDYYYSGSGTAGPTDPLYQFGTTYNYTLSRSITYYLDKGVPANKLVLGLPYYGWDYPTSGASIPSATTGAGSSRTYATVMTNTSGFYGSGNQSWQSDAISNAYVYTSGTSRQCFMSMDSAFNKRLEHVLHTGIAGIGIWALGYDNGYAERWNSIQSYLTDCYQDPCSGVIHDFGGPLKSYYNNEDYTWTIQPEGAVSIDVDFTQFDVELNWDYLYIYDGPNTSSPQIPGSPFTGTTSPGSFTTSSGAVTFRFTSDVSTVTPGFYATYSCNQVPAPVASMTVDAPLQICEGDSVYFESISSNAETWNWSSSEGIFTTPNAENSWFHPTSSGIYDITLQVGNAQGIDVQTLPFEIEVGQPVVMDVNVNSTTLELPDATVLFSNNSSGAEWYFWDFGDGTSSTDMNPWHTYIASGVYTVTLIAYNSLCGNDTLTWDISVNAAVLDEETMLDFNLFPNPVENWLNIDFNEKMENAEIEIMDMTGRIVSRHHLIDEKLIKLDVRVLSSGFYVIRIRREDSLWRAAFEKL